MSENMVFPIGTDQSVEEGFYRACLTDYERADDGQYGPQVKLYLTIEDEGEYKGSVLAAFAKTYPTLTPRMKLYQIAEAFLATDLQQLGSVKMADLVGESCRIRVEEEAREDGSIFARVASFSRLKDQKAQPNTQPDLTHLQHLVQFCRDNGLATESGNPNGRLVCEKLGLEVKDNETSADSFKAYTKAVMRRQQIEGDAVYDFVLKELISALALSQPKEELELANEPDPEPIPFE